MNNLYAVPYRFVYAGFGVFLLFGAQGAAAQDAAAIAFSRAPASVGHLPAPNVIVSVDDSGSMGEEGIETLKQALRSTFTEANVPDGSIRLGWQSMNRCSEIPSFGDCKGINAVRVLDAQRRADFREWIDTLVSDGTTPSHTMLYNAGEYLSGPTGINSPWAKEPGVQELPYMACRRSYNVFLSDGGWNIAHAPDASAPDASYYWLNRVGDAWAQRVGNFDGTSKNLPEALDFGGGVRSARFDASSAQTRIYRDDFGALQPDGNGGYTSFPTLSDLAFYYWARDLQPGIPNEVHPHFAVNEPERISQGSKSVTLDRNWNPKNNPATWQHMTLYTVGFLNAAHLTEPLEFGSTTWSGGDYENLVLGNKTWADPLLERGGEAWDNPTRYPELWHAAINTRGKFIPAPTADTLAPAFKDILNTILAGNQMPLTSMAVTANTTRFDSSQYASGYSAVNWTGQVLAYSVAPGNAAVDPSPLWNAADVMDAAAASAPGRFVEQRRMFTARQGGVTHSAVTGVAWQPNALSLDYWLDAAQIHQLGAGDEAQARAVAAYIQGDRTREEAAGGSFRDRASLLGDIVNSRIWLMHGNHFQSKTKHPSRPDVVFVGANDGALHAFDAATGAEVMAYVPRGVFPRLRSLTDRNYTHQYLVDGSPMTRDVNYDPADPASFAHAQTYLAGALGAGGKGYFVLNVTNKGALAFDGIAPTDLVKTDYTFAASSEADALAGTAGFAESDEHMGHIFSAPTTDQVNRFDAVQLAYLNATVGSAGTAGKWAFITGNGYNSDAGAPVLYVQPLDGRPPIKIHALGRTPTTRGLDLYSGQGNGLSAVRPVDVDGNGTVDYVYAGDLLGNLWKFDLRAADPAQWQNPLDGRPLLHAPQAGAITAAPSYMVHPEGGLQLLFGTGRLLTDGDRTSGQRGHIVSVRDDFTNTPLDWKALTNIEASIASHASGALEASAAGVAGATGAEPAGWYFQLPYEGTRVLDNATWLTGSAFYVPFQRPASGSEEGEEETCSVNYRPARNYFALVDIWRGNTFKPLSDRGREMPQNLFLIGEDVLANSFLYGEGGAKGVAPPGSPTVDFVFGQGQGVTPTWRVVE